MPPPRRFSRLPDLDFPLLRGYRRYQLGAEYASVSGVRGPGVDGDRPGGVRPVFRYDHDLAGAEHHARLRGGDRGVSRRLVAVEEIVSVGRRLRCRVIEIQGSPYQAKSVAEDKIFGTRTVWRGQIKVQVSDPTRTVVDILDDPSIGGGIRHVAEVVGAYLRSEHRSDVLLAEYAQRVGNRTIFKRLGYLLESLGIAAPELIETCKNAMSSGVSLLDPTLGDEGHVVRRWNLRLNAVLGSEEAES